MILDEEIRAETTYMHELPTTRGTLYVIAAPSGTGKTSLTSALIKSMPNIVISISHTTRPQRPGEQQNKDYFFVTESQFEQMIAAEEFLEHAKVFGNYYGTTRQWVEKRLERGIDIILEIDWQGAEQVRNLFPESVQIFILPPSAELLRQRLQTRKQDSPEVIETRLAAASKEVAHYGYFDYLVVNDIFGVALNDLQAIVKAHRLLRKSQSVRYAKLLAQLMQNK